MFFSLSLSLSQVICKWSIWPVHCCVLFKLYLNIFKLELCFPDHIVPTCLDCTIPDLPHSLTCLFCGYVNDLGIRSPRERSEQVTWKVSGREKSAFERQPGGEKELQRWRMKQTSLHLENKVDAHCSQEGWLLRARVSSFTTEPSLIRMIEK